MKKFSEDFKLTKRQREVLQALLDDDGIDLAHNKGAGWWIGDRQTNGKLVNSLLRRCLLREISFQDGIIRYTINESGERALKGIKPIYHY